MTETRRRLPVASTSTLPVSQGSLPRRAGASVRSLSSGSITPMEDEEDRPKRSTRGRNPLPPTKGPLFPPLPPKPLRAKSSPKRSQGSEAGTAGQHADEQDELPAEEAPVAESSGSKAKLPSPEAAADKPSWSDRSLTPAPPSSDNVEVVVEALGVNGSARRGARPNIDVKVEIGEDEDGGDDEEVEDTPKQTRLTRGRLAPPASAGTTPTGSVTSDRGANGNGPRTSLGRRRRGEEQLLLDDHLLPVEIRRTGSLSGKRKGQAADVVEKQEQMDDAEEEEAGEEEVEDEKAEEVEEEEPEVEMATDELPVGDDIIEQDIVDPDEEEPDEGDGEEVTRCVCQLEDGDPLMVACDKCNVWQHGPCVGIWADEEAPDGQNFTDLSGNGCEARVAIYDLKHLHSSGDRYPPSQSKRWNLPASKGKPAPRGRAKEVAPVPESGDQRRLSRRGESSTHPPAPTSHREKSAKAEPIRPGREQRRGSSHHRKASIGSRSPIRESRSPTAMVNGHKDTTRKRSTMNSRDAAFEDAVQAAIEASRREMGEDGEEIDGEGEDEPVVDEGGEEKDKEVEKKNKGKRKREEEIAPHSSHAKVKHPNQYTYRPKPASSAPVIPPVPSPVRRPAQHSTPAPVIPPPALHEHGTRRAGALANGAREAPFIAVSVTHLGWHLPDYLSSFSDIFPSPNPIPLQVRSPRTLPPIPKNHFINHRYGPFTEERDEDRSALVLPPDPAEREALGKKGETHTEPPARMKYPQRRVTTGEMRKRVRHMLEFCGRVEVEEGRRKERKGKIGIPDAELPEEVVDGHGDVEMANGEASGSGSKDPSYPLPKPTSTSSGPSAAQLLAELTADLNDFNETWARGGFAPTASNAAASSSAHGWSGGYGGYSPMPPGSATFGQASGWPTSGLGRDVVGPEGYEEEAEPGPEGTSAAGLDEAEVPVNAEFTPINGDALQDDPPIAEAESTMEVPVEVYRQGQVVGVVSTQAEDEAVERIKENTARDEAHAEADAEGERESASAMDAAVALLQGVGTASVDPAAASVAEEDERVGEADGDGDGDVVMAE